MDSAAGAIRIPGLSITLPVLERELRPRPHREPSRSGAGEGANGACSQPARSRTPLVGYSPPSSTNPLATNPSLLSGGGFETRPLLQFFSCRKPPQRRDSASNGSSASENRP